MKRYAAGKPVQSASSTCQYHRLIGVEQTTRLTGGSDLYKIFVFCKIVKINIIIINLGSIIKIM